MSNVRRFCAVVSVLLAATELSWADDEIDIDVVFYNGPLTSSSGLIRLFVPSLPAIGESRIYGPNPDNIGPGEAWRLNDLHAEVDGVYFFDDSDDPLYDNFPIFNIRRTAALTGDGGGHRSINMMLYGPGGELFMIFVDGLLVGHPSGEHGVCAFYTGPPYNGPRGSQCTIRSVTMNDVVQDDDMGGNPKPGEDAPRNPRLKTPPNGSREDFPLRAPKHDIRML